MDDQAYLRIGSGPVQGRTAHRDQAGPAAGLAAPIDTTWLCVE